MYLAASANFSHSRAHVLQPVAPAPRTGAVAPRLQSGPIVRDLHAKQIVLQANGQCHLLSCGVLHHVVQSLFAAKKELVANLTGQPTLSRLLGRRDPAADVRRGQELLSTVSDVI